MLELVDILAYHHLPENKLSPSTAPQPIIYYFVIIQHHMNFIYAWEQNVFTRIEKKPVNDKQMFHTFLFNIRNYSPEVNNIQRREAELDIILPRVNNFDIKQKKHGIFVLLYATNTKQDLGRKD